jgi:amyloid beta precursor protein binding protein 1
VGHFTIIDGKKVSEADLGNNFFVAPDTVGKSRAAVTYELLQELNSLSKGEFIEQVLLSL